jgi:transcription initiation factor TFIIB
MRDTGLSTVIGYGLSDARGRKLKPRKMVQFKRLRKWHQRSWEISFDPKSLTKGLRNITKVSYELGLPRNVLETASYIYRRAISEDLIKGRSVQTIAAASIYLACRQCGVIRKIDEVSRAANLSRKEGARAIRFLLRRLDLDAPLYPFEGYISKYVSHLSLPGETEKIALTLADTAFRLRLTSGRGASSIAASCVYIACQVSGESRTQGDISKIAGVTEVTIRNRYKELLENMKITFQL